MKTASIAKTLLSVAFAAATVTFVQAQPKESAIVAHRGYWNCKEGGYARNSLAALESRFLGQRIRRQHDLGRRTADLP